MPGVFAVLKNPLLSITRLWQWIRTSRGQGVDVTTEDWDTLVILDACRYDMFESVNNLSGTLEARFSKGSATDEFIKANFGDGEFDDLVYVTANPRVNLTFDGRFHDVIDVWQEGWDHDLQTVPPAAVADATVQALETYPNKRIVSHFIQPHAPFIGEFARKNLVSHSTLPSHRPGSNEESSTNENVWTLLRRAEIEQKTVERAYAENLEITLPHVQRIMDAEPGKTVVTSDHGNLLGERIAPFMRRFYGHPSRFHADALVRVPWLEHDNGGDRDIVAEATDNNDVELGEDIEEKLENLGYA